VLPPNDEAFREAQKPIQAIQAQQSQGELDKNWGIGTAESPCVKVQDIVRATINNFGWFLIPPLEEATANRTDVLKLKLCREVCGRIGRVHCRSYCGARPFPWIPQLSGCGGSHGSGENGVGDSRSQRHLGLRGSGLSGSGQLGCRLPHQ